MNLEADLSAPPAKTAGAAQPGESLTPEKENLPADASNVEEEKVQTSPQQEYGGGRRGKNQGGGQGQRN